MSGLLAPLGLEISFRERSAQQVIGCEVSSSFCVIALAVRLHAPSGLLEHLRYSSFSCRPYWNCVAISVTSLWRFFDTVLQIACFPIFNVVGHLWSTRMFRLFS